MFEKPPPRPGKAQKSGNNSNPIKLVGQSLLVGAVLGYASGKLGAALKKG
jgi:hypothetical protein